MPKATKAQQPQQVLVHETAEMLFHSASDVPLVSLAGIWTVDGGNLSAMTSTEIRLSASEVDAMNQAIYNVVRDHLDRAASRAVDEAGLIQ